jgi:thioester reductase-like protein
MAYQTVKSFYKNKNIFLTGGSGFVGISYIEKVLRSIPDIGSIYIILRPRKGQSIQERLEILKNNSVKSYTYSHILTSIVFILNNIIFYYYFIRYLIN